ncbi:MAG: alpha/beta hydrolase [bacterium]|nr:alpha/beta hydrolase [bacterium]
MSAFINFPITCKIQIQIALISASLFFIWGCMSTPPAISPIHSIPYIHPSEKKPDTLIVFLHGKGGKTSDFDKAGFIETVRAKGFLVDMIAVNGHLGYYFKRNLIERLRNDIIKPALTKGYKHIWFVGVSLGGLGSMLYSMNYPEEVDGILLMAPFMGNSGSIEMIVKSGGVRNWDPETARIKTWQKELWNYIKEVTSRSDSKPQIYLAYGTDDEYGPTSEVLEEVIPQGRVFKSKGGHNWRDWTPLWKEFLDNSPLPRIQ